jgi:transcriptional regulator with PAS, ATPase and Fis domain
MNNPIIKEKCRQNLQKNRHNHNNKKSEETKKKISLMQESKVIYIQDDLGNTYRGLKSAAKELDVTFGTIWKALNGYCKTVKGRTLTKVSKGAI